MDNVNEIRWRSAVGWPRHRDVTYHTRPPGARGAARPGPPAREPDRLSLQPYPGGDSKVRYGYATAANEGIQVVGWVENSLFGQMDAFWNNDVTHTLSLLQPLPGDWTSIAWGMNDLGQAVGESHPPFHTRAVLWTEDALHTPVDLGMLDGDTDSMATAINNPEPGHRCERLSQRRAAPLPLAEGPDGRPRLVAGRERRGLGDPERNRDQQPGTDRR
jgi:hypothetical protein